MTPVERIIEAERRAWDDWSEPIDLSNVERVRWRSAVEILKAIREPSKAMIEAALSRSHADAPETMYHSIWKSMIDAALSET